MDETILAFVSALILSVVAGMFSLPWLSRRNARKSTEATAAQVYDGLAQKWLDRYDAELEQLRREVHALRLDLEQERLWTAILAGALRSSGVPLPDRPKHPQRDV